MAELPDFPSWVAEAEKWEAAIRKDERAKAVKAVKRKMFMDPTNSIQREITAACMGIWEEIEG